MPQLLWFLVGFATCLVIAFLASARQRRPARRRVAKTSAADRVELRLARSILDDTSRDIEALAASVGREIGALASAVQGNADLLAEEVGSRGRSAGLENSVRRLRLFAEKILSFAHVQELPIGPVDMRALVSRLVREIDELGLGLTVEHATSEFLPPALGSEVALRDAILFLVDTLLHIESRTGRLHLRTYAQVCNEAATCIEVEICAEAEAGAPQREPPSRTAVQLGYVAARNLLEAMGAGLSFDEIEGLSVTCVVTLPTAQIEDDAPCLDTPAVPEHPHQYGGVLVLEDDPEIRELLATELGRTGRNVVTCVDGASARSLIEATPERFELVVLERDARIESGESIARFAAQRIRDPKILLLTTGNTTCPSSLLETGARVEVVRKPFGVRDLRARLELLVGPPAIVD
jgi:CheY-like chemotaxis protein